MKLDVDFTETLVVVALRVEQTPDEQSLGEVETVKELVFVVMVAFVAVGVGVGVGVAVTVGVGEGVGVG